MNKIFYASITGPDYARQMGEVMEPDHNQEWDGDVASYLENLDNVPEYREGSEYIPGDVIQNFGGLDPKNICVVFMDGQPTEVWWSSDAE